MLWTRSAATMEHKIGLRERGFGVSSSQTKSASTHPATLLLYGLERCRAWVGISTFISASLA